MNKNNWLAVLLSVTLSLCATTMMVQFKFSEPTPTVIERAVPNPIAISDDVEELRLMAGLTALEGQGVTVEMDDSVNSAKSGENPNLYVIHDDDVLRVINELRSAGAEAIAINGQRLIETSEIRCAGPTLSVNNVRSAAPFIISAIGDKAALENSIKMRGGVEQTLKVWGIKIEVKAADDIYIPPFKGNRSYKYAQPTAEKIVGREK